MPLVGGAEMQVPSVSEITRDPVCGMVLVRGLASLVSEYRGRKYYFCCSGCRNSFERDPSLQLKGYRAQMALPPAQREAWVLIEG